MSAYPIGFAVEYAEPRSRVTTFFRLLLVIPHLFVLMFWGLAAYVVVIVAWFALLLTGRWPTALYDFTAQFLRYITRVYGYTFLLTDAYPPFGGGDDPGYPIHVPIAPPQEEYSRLKVLLRIFYVIPAAIIQYALVIMAEIIALIAWFAIVITGRQVRGLQQLTELGMAYMARSLGLFMLVTETYPPLSNDQPQVTGGPERPALP